MSPEPLQDNTDFMRGVVQRIATGPTMSKDLPRTDAERAMRLLLTGEADEVQAAIFLIALRMKRETDEELAGVLQAIRAGMPQISLGADELVCVVDPYDGCLRGTPVSAFLPAVLSACGLRVLSHGVSAMGPKFGATHAGVLQAAGARTDLSLEEARQHLEDTGAAWAYIDQSVLAPELASLSGLRSRIVKRPCLTTIESVLCPFQPSERLHLVTGFVHTGYPEIYAALAREAGFATSILVRGVEGSVVPSLAQAARYVRADQDQPLEVIDIDPAALGMSHEQRALPLPALDAPVSRGARSVAQAGNRSVAKIAAAGAQLGLAALKGEAGMARDALVYSAAVVLHGLGKQADMREAAAQACEALDSGAAFSSFSKLQH